MLTELSVEELGVIAGLSLRFGPGMTVLTGETGAGKTLVVEAIELLLGARADPVLVRQGAAEARVEARFEVDETTMALLAATEGVTEVVVPGDGEVVLGRVVPADGRSRAYVNGRPVPTSVLAALGRRLVELHGQHAYQALVVPAAQRAALDLFGGQEAADARRAYREARARLRELREERVALGGDARERAREADLLRFQVGEIDAAGIEDPDEEQRLAEEEAWLADAAGHREAAAAAHAVLSEAVTDGLGAAIAALGGRPAFADAARRLAVLQEEVGELARAVRRIGDAADDDPHRLEAVAARRRQLRDLRRKYGESLAEVLSYRNQLASRLEAVLRAEHRAAALEEEWERTLRSVQEAGARLSRVRREAAARLGPAVTAVLEELAMPGARFSVEVRSLDRGSAETDDGAELPPEDGFDEVHFLLAANPGEVPRVLSRVASGGELARTMLAARVVLDAAPPTLVFDEVDAGIGGRAGVAVGRKLATVAEGHQVLCVTHLAQVAAFADAHVVVRKVDAGGRAVAEVEVLDADGRLRELSRMLAGMGTRRAMDHAEELLVAAAKARRAEVAARRP